MNPSRQPKGTPSGGQFAPTQRAEAEVTLDGGPLAAVRPFAVAPIVDATEPPRVRARLTKDLARTWRRPDGSLHTLGHVIATEGMDAKTVRVENGVRRYYLVQDPAGEDQDFEPTRWQVSKETWERFGAPDERTGADHAAETLGIAKFRFTKARERATETRSTSDLFALRDAKAALVAARAEHRQVVAEERSGNLPHTFNA